MKDALGEKINQQCRSLSIKFNLKDKKSREYDSQFVDGALVTDLGLKLLQGIADQYIKGLSIERYLQQIGLAEYGLNGLRLKRAAFQPYY